MLDALVLGLGNPYVVLPCVFAVVFFLVAAYLAIALHRREKKAEQRLKQARADITDMTILFQTMRDIIGQQKKLAREFNEELEHKMGQVKHILNQGMEKNKQLYEKQQRIAGELEEAQARIDALYRQSSTAPKPRPQPENQGARAAAPEPARPEDVLPPSLSKTHAATPAPPSRPLVNGRPAPVDPVSERQSRAAGPRPAPQPAPRVPRERPAVAPDADRFADTGVTKSSFSTWVAEDFSAKPAAPAPARTDKQEGTFDPEAEAAPGNGDAAREAFRALLNMPPEEAPSRPPLDLGDTLPATRPTEAPDMGAGPENGTAAMQQRVLEYSEAGMTVAEVSRELGIGKGEVRLMLSLAKQNYPPRA